MRHFLRSLSLCAAVAAVGCTPCGADGVSGGPLCLLESLGRADNKAPDPFKRQPAQGDEKLSSLDVEVTYEPNGAGCVQLTSDGKLPPPETPGDYCPPGPGSVAEPLPYQTGRPYRVFVNIRAIGTKGSYGENFPISGNVGLSLNAGQIVSGTPTRLQNGVVNHQKVVIRNAPGRAQLWAEAGTLLLLGEKDLPPTFSMGASNPIQFGQPTLPDVQRTDNDATSPLEGQRVTLQGGNLMVTNIIGNGFYVQDMTVPLVGGLPKWNGLFIFAFNGVDNLSIGSRLLKLRGAITSFQGMTQLAEPEYVTAGGNCAPKREPSRYGQEPTDSEEGGAAVAARCPPNAQCVDGRCIPNGDTREYDHRGRAVCHTVNTCGTSNAECPDGTACLDRDDWRTTDSTGAVAHTCQACPTSITGEFWTTPGQTPGFCGPLYKGDALLTEKLRNESVEGALVQLNDVTVHGLDLNDDFFRSGFESFGQWKVILPDGACATVTSENATAFDVVAANTASTKLKSFTGNMRQVRFKSGSAFWMVDLRHREDLVPLATP